METEKNPAVLPEGPPTLSVVMPNYNHAAYIGDALEAILGQSRRPAEVIVVDDCSTDNSLELIAAIAARDPAVRLLRNERNMGAVASARRALELATGDYIYGAAADDMVLPGFFEKSMALLARYPQAGLCFADPAYLTDAAGAVREDRRRLGKEPAYISPEQLTNHLRKRLFGITGHTTIYKRSALLEAQSFIPELKWGSDWLAVHAIAFRRGACYVPEPLAMMRCLRTSYSARGLRDRLECRHVVAHMLRLLKSPAYEDVLPRFRRSGILACYGAAMLRILAESEEHRDFATPLLLRRSLENVLAGAVARNTPSILKRIYRMLPHRYRSYGTVTQHFYPAPRIG